MAFSSGTFSLVAGNPVVTGTTISSTVQNNTMNDVATGLTTCVLKDGTQTATASVPFAQGLTVGGTTTMSSSGAIFVGSVGAMNGEVLGASHTGATVVAAFKNSGNAAEVITTWNSDGTGNNLFQTFNTESGFTLRGSIDYNRGGAAVRYNTTSDARLKTKNGAAKYDPLWIGNVAASIYNVTWKETGYVTDTFVAQDLYGVEPDAVKKGDDAPELSYDDKGRCTSTIWGVDPSKLVAKVILEVAALRQAFDAYRAAHP